jgi:hypothetical protein
MGVLALAGVDLPFVNAVTAVFLIVSGLFLVGTVVTPGTSSAAPRRSEDAGTRLRRLRREPVRSATLRPRPEREVGGSGGQDGVDHRGQRAGVHGERGVPPAARNRTARSPTGTSCTVTRGAEVVGEHDAVEAELPAQPGR